MAIDEKYAKLRSLCPMVTPENQEAFAEFWGDDFVNMIFQNCWIGASPDGTMIGIYLKAQSKEVRASIPFEIAWQIQLNLAAALGVAIDRMKATAAGKKGN